MSNTPTANFAYNKPAIGDRGWGTTWNANLDSIDSDFAEEHRSAVGQRGKHGPKVTILQTSTNNALVIDHSGTGSQIVVDINKTGTNSGNVIDVLNSGTGTGILVTQAGAATVLDIQKTNTSSGVGINVANSGIGFGVFITQVGNNSALHIVQDGSDEAFSISQNTNNRAINVSKTNTGTSDVVLVSNSGTGSAIQITQAGAGPSITIDQNGASTAINVTQNATNNKTLFLRKTGTGAGAVLDIDNTGTGTGVNISQVGDGDGCYILQSGGSRGLYVEKTHTGASRAVVIDNDGTGAGLNILQDGNALALDIDKAHTGSANVIDIDQSGSGYDIEGNADLWRVDNRGHAIFSSTPSKLKNALNGANTFNSTNTWDRMPLSSGIGAAALDSAFNGGCAFDGQYVYYCPLDSATFVSYDTTMAFTSIDAWEQIAMSSVQGAAALTTAYLGVVFDGRYMYFVPFNSDTFIRYNTKKAFTSTASWEQVAMQTAFNGSAAVDLAFASATFDGRYVYYSAYNSDTFVRYDTTGSFAAASGWSQMLMSSAQGGTAVDAAYQASTFDSRYVYFCPRASASFIRYDTTASFTAIASWTQIALSSGQGGAASDADQFHGSTFDGRYVYYIPENSDTFVRFDTTKSFTSITSWQQATFANAVGSAAFDAAFIGATFDGRYVYAGPSNSDTLIRFDTTQTTFNSSASWQQVSFSNAVGNANPGGGFGSLAFDGYYVYWAPRNSDTFIRFCGNNTAYRSPTEYAQVSS